MKFRLSNPLTSLYNQNNITDKALRRDLNLFISSVSLGMVFFAVSGGMPFTGFATALGADDFFFSILLAVPVAATFLQFVSAWLMEKTRRRKLIFIVSGLLQRSLWIPVALVPLFIPMEQPTLRKWMVIALLTASSVGGAIMNVPFFSWMTDVVPMSIRGRYLGIRSSLSTALGLGSALLASFVLDHLHGLTGYMWVFGVAAVFGIGDIATFIFVRDPGMHVEPPRSYVKTLVGIFKNKSFMHYLLFWTAWIFCWNLAGPFYGKYTLEKLHFSLTLTTLTGQVATSVMNVVFMQIWGRQLDRHGHHWLLLRCGVMACVLPLFWLFAAPGSVLPVLLFSMGVGAFLCGVDLTSVQMLMSVTPKNSRALHIAAYTVLTSLAGTSLGNLAGGAALTLMERLGDIDFMLLGIHFDRYKVLFLAASVLRLLIILFLLPLIANMKHAGPHEDEAGREERKMEHAG